MMSVPVMSDGIRSGVNWMRVNLRSSTCASVWTSSVFARPGTPTMRLLPPTKSVKQDELNDVVLAHNLLLQLRDNLLSARIQAIGKRDVVCRFEIHCALMEFHERPFRQVERPALTIPGRSEDLRLRERLAARPLAAESFEDFPSSAFDRDC